MHPYIVYELARQHIADREREAVTAHLLKESRAATPERSHSRGRPSFARLRRYPRPVTHGGC